jgi:hypothetical protein
MKRRKPVTRSSTRKTTTHYRYLPLDETAQEIRLLTLLPGASVAEIRILLHANSFTQHNVPKYEALSYAWGSSKYVVNIKVGLGNDSLAVTQNLAVALRHLRHKNEVRVLWIDAICVDQGNLEERSRQVQRMSDIYKKAQRVVVWLGPAKNHSGFALKLIQELSSKIEVDWLNQVMRPATEDVHDQHWASAEAEIPFDNHQWHALQALLSRSWFERLWVWQEIRLADLNTAIVMCGFDFILWRNFKKAVYCLFCKANQSIAFKDKIRQAFRLSNDSGPKILMDLVNISTQAKCSDDRDRIYALLSILDSSSVTINIIPDYTKTASQVYQDTALSILSQTRKLDLLSYSEMASRRIDIPSWVPDWSCVRDCSPLECQLAAGSTWSNTSYLGGGVLQTTGVLLGAILHVQAIPYVIFDEDIIEAVQSLVFSDVLDGVYVAGGSMLDAYCRTLCGNLFSETILPCSSDYPSFDESKKALRDTLVSQSEVSSAVANWGYFSMVGRHLIGRILFKTYEGCIGLAPRAAQPNDQICVLLGCRVPLILRPRTSGQYQVVGECYIHGSMNGEALHGPLPTHFERVVQVAPDSGLEFVAYVNRHTKEVHVQDPRLGPLPENWRLKSHDKDNLFSWIVNDETGEGHDEPGLDPRLTPEALKERGVDLKEFELM